MINFQCHACEKMHSAKDEMAGKRAKCACGTIIVVPTPSLSLASVTTGANCMHCQAIIQPHWKGCPACGGALAPLSTPQVTAQAPMAFAQTKPEAISPTIKVGNDSVVKTNLNQSVNVSGQQPNSTAGLTNQGHASSIHVGDGSVVKTEINSTTNISNDNSLNFQGNYVANQTVLQITSTEEMVSLLTGKISDQEIIMIEAQIRTLPNNPQQLLSILALTLSHMVREIKIKFKKQKGILNFSYDEKYSSGFFEWTSAINTRRLKLCGVILERLHESGHNRTDKQLMTLIEQIDECFINLETTFKQFTKLKFAKILIPFGILSAISGIVIGIKSENYGSLAIAIPYLMASVGGIYYYYVSQTSIDHRILEFEIALEQIISKTR